MQVLSVSPGPAGIPGVIVIRPESMIQYMVTLVIAFVIGFIATMILAKLFNKKQNV